MNAIILLDHEPVPDGGRHHVRALVRLEGTAPEARDRVPLNLSVVLDRSGSMAGPKLDAATHAAALLLGRIWPDDVASVVVYDDRVETLLEPGPRRDHAHVDARLRAVEAGCSTNLSGGWLAGRRHVEAHLAEGSSNRVILLTDGLANVGLTDPTELARLFGSARERGVRTTTIGFGADYDERLLATVADAGGGNTHYIEAPEQAPAVFEKELEELLGVSAQNVRAEVRAEAGAEIVAVHHTYPRTEQDGRLLLDMGDLYASEPKLLLLELLTVPGRVLEAVTKVATITITADVRTDEGGLEARTIELPIDLDAAEGPVVHPEVRRELSLLEAAQARERAVEHERTGDWELGADTLRESAAALRSLDDADERVTEEAADLESMAERLVSSGFDAHDLKYMAKRSWDSGRSKSTGWRVTSRSERERRGRGGGTEGQGAGSDGTEPDASS